MSIIPDEGYDCKGRHYKRIPLKSAKNFEGITFNYLTGLFRIKHPGKNTYWLWRCKCGNLVIRELSNVKANKTIASCGCFIKQKQREEQLKDISGQKFSRLTALEYIGNRKWKCLCDCGSISYVYGPSLRNGQTKSCGCIQKEFSKKNGGYRDLTGQVFGFLTVLKEEPSANKQARWLCKCACGREKVYPSVYLTYYKIRSCGCQHESAGENIISQILDEHHIPFQRQYHFSDLRSPKGGILRYDFALIDKDDKVIRLIEFDGAQHSKGWFRDDSEEDFVYRQALDKIKNEYSLSHHIPLVRIPFTKKNKITYEMLLGDEYLVS